MKLIANSGDSESEEASETDNHDSGEKSELANTKRLIQLEKCIKFNRLRSWCIVSAYMSDLTLFFG